MSVDFDENTDYLVYDRELKAGTGERIYGIVVAKSIIKNSEFINKALEIKNILLDNDPDLPIVPDKRSRYNAELIVDRCGICEKKNTHFSPTPLEVHHINPQAECEDGFVKSKPHLKKNHLSNLIEICQECHDAVHNGEIEIDGYCMTSNGRQIIFRHIDPVISVDTVATDTDGSAKSDGTVKAVKTVKTAKTVKPVKTIKTVKTAKSARTVRAKKKRSSTNNSDDDHPTTRLNII